MSSQVKEVATRFLLKGQIQVATSYTGRNVKTGTKVLTRKMMSRPLKDVATYRRAEKKKRMSRHHFDVATWKIVGKKEISCNVLRSQPEENKWKAKDVAT